MAGKREERGFSYFNLLFSPFSQHPRLTIERTHTHKHTQSLFLCQDRAPENCCQVAAAQETAEFLAPGRIDGCGQVIVAELTCVKRSALWC